VSNLILLLLSNKANEKWANDDKRENIVEWKKKKKIVRNIR
jgi:hypothetical protein